jgi:type I restriction enzyme S subunit
MAFDMSDFRHLDDDAEYHDYRLQHGDIVFTRYNGSRNYVGVAALYRSDEEFVYPDKLIRCDVLLPLIDAGYIEKAVNCGASRAFIESRIRTTAGQAGISGADLKAMPVPICSVEEQKAINEIVEDQLSGLVRLEAEVESRLAQAEALRQSILKKAFSGRLVAQDPTDELASALLERIRAERNGAPAKRTRNGKNGQRKNGKKNAA